MTSILRMTVMSVMVGAAAVLGVWAGDRNPATDSLLAEARPPDVEPGGTLNIAY